MRKQTEIIFWMAISVLLIVIFGASSGSYKYSTYFVSFYIPVIIATAWFINSILIPKYLLKQRFLSFFLYLTYTIIVSLNLIYILVFIAFFLLSVYMIQNLSSLLTDFRLMPLIMYLIVLLSSFISLLQQYFDQKKMTEKNEIESDKAIIIRSERKNVRIKYSEIIYIESMSDYVRIFLEKGNKVSSKITISTLDSKLPENFIRVHRSYIINVDKVSSYTREEIIITDKNIPVSRTYKAKALEFLDEYNVSSRQ